LQCCILLPTACLQDQKTFFEIFILAILTGGALQWRDVKRGCDRHGRSIYFSVVIGANVGCGDIHAVDPWAKILVIAQILLSLVYTIFFSVAASFLKGPEDRR